jgi:hypothetical protein
MNRKPPVVVVENELLAGRGAVEPELAPRDDLAARPGAQPCASDSRLKASSATSTSSTCFSAPAEHAFVWPGPILASDLTTKQGNLQAL